MANARLTRSQVAEGGGGREGRGRAFYPTSSETIEQRMRGFRQTTPLNAHHTAILDMAKQ